MIVLILVLSFVFYLIGINQSLWLDEAITANVVKLPIEKIISDFSVYDFHPPLYYWFLSIWTKILGNDVIIMRLSSVIFSIITIWIVFLIGKEIKNQSYGFWAAIYVAVNPLFVYYSQELRMYSMAVMWLTGAVYFWIKITSLVLSKNLKKNKWINILGFNIMTFLAFMTFYGAIFLVAVMIIYLISTKKFKLLLGCSYGIILAILIISPLLVTQFKNSEETLNQITNWSLVLGKINLKNLALIPLKFSLGRVTWYPKNTYYLVGGLWTVVVWGLIVRNFFKNKKIGKLLVLPIVLGIIFSIKSPLLQYFRFLYLLPIISLLLADIRNNNIKVFLFFGFFGFSLMYLLNPKMHREDWKGLVKHLEDYQKVYMVASFGDPIKFYNSTIQIGNIKTSLPKEDKVYLIPYGEVIHGIDTNKKMSELGYKQREIKNFQEVRLEFWER